MCVLCRLCSTGNQGDAVWVVCLRQVMARELIAAVRGLGFDPRTQMQVRLRHQAACEAVAGRRFDHDTLGVAAGVGSHAPRSAWHRRNQQGVTGSVACVFHRVLRGACAHFHGEWVVAVHSVNSTQQCLVWRLWMACVLVIA